MTQHSASDLRSLTQHSWTLRLLLAALLAFASHVILWTPIPGIIDAVLLALGYLALSSLLLEIAARYRLRDLFGLLTLAGIAGMANGLILNPQSALIEVPRTLISRAMGGQAIAGLIALALFLALTNGSLRSRRILIVTLILAALIGVGWGTWGHWSSQFFDNGVEVAPLRLLFDGALGLMLITLALTVERAASSTDLRLDSRGWAFTLIVLVGLLVLHLLQGQVDVLSLSLLVTLSAFAIMILWFQKRQKGATLLDHVASAPVSWAQWIALVIVFALGGVVGYLLPHSSADVNDPVAVIGAIFTAYGLIWLPALTIVLGARAFTRQARAMRL